MADKIKFNIVKENFSDFIDKLKDLTSIDDTVKLKIDNDQILMYSTLGGSIMLAFKNYTINTKEYLQYKEDLEFTYDIVISNCGKLVKNLDFIRSEDKIVMEITCNVSPDDSSVMTARSMKISGGKLKFNWMTAERYEVRDINRNTLKQRLDLKNRKWSFAVTNSQFSDIKKLSTINSDKIINVGVNKGTVVLSENAAWEFEIGEIEYQSANFILNKRFLKCINDKVDLIEFNLFESFILVKDSNSNLMLSYEQDFSDDDV